MTGVQTCALPISTTGWYLIAYAVWRFVIEMFRGDAERGKFGALYTSQWISILILLAGVAVLLLARRFNWKKGKPFKVFREEDLTVPEPDEAAEEAEDAIEIAEAFAEKAEEAEEIAEEAVEEGEEAAEEAAEEAEEIAEEAVEEAEENAEEAVEEAEETVEDATEAANDTITNWVRGTLGE